MSADYNITKPDDIFDIPDTKTGYSVVKSWGLSTSGLNSKKDFIFQLLKNYRNRYKDRDDVVDQVCV